ncbi:MAG: UDP-N-acetylmuramate--L-alanine ligase [Planctomycetota bacterium]|jgi:UDP-N-acetylmuramate--alanine ligase
MLEAKPNARTHSTKIKAVHMYEVISSNNNMSVAGKKFHLIGAGGIGMSGLAQLLIKNGAAVSGSDQQQSSITDNLNRIGCNLKIGHSLDNLDTQTDVVVVSAAIQENNPELKSARQKGIEIKKYARMLGELMNSYEGLAISGTHGKSTTSGWLVCCMKNAGVDTNFVVGADINQMGCCSGVGESSYFVAEACEYDRSFLNLRPKVGCILNIEQDHLDYYKNENDIVDAFTQFALNIKSNGVLIANGQDSNAAKVIETVSQSIRCETFGLEEGCNFIAKDINLENGQYSFEIHRNGKCLGKTAITLPGIHNVYNALAVAGIWVNCGLDAEQILELIPDFTGMDRRLMLKAEVKGVICLDDYAHHPTEIKASLKAMREKYCPERIWCVFQPHQHSRTRFLLDDFAESFKLADVTIVPEIYFVRDTDAAKKEINSKVLVGRIKSNGSEALFIDSFSGICEHLKANVKSGDLVVTMGAGDVWKVADEYIQWLRENR